MATPRATWSGTISFGMISIPVRMYTATDEGKKVRFNQINKDTGNRVTQPKVDSVTGQPVGEVVKGYEYRRGQYVLVEDQELQELTPDRSSSVELLNFLDEDEIDPLYFDTPYYLGADKGGDKPYVLLEKALRAKKKMAVGKFVMKSKEYLCAIRPVGEQGLSISTLRWHEQLRSNEDMLPENVVVSDQEIEMAGQLIDSMSSDVDLTVLRDTYTDELKELIEQKAQGTLVKPQQTEDEEEDLPDNDIFAALEASLANVDHKAV